MTQTHDRSVYPTDLETHLYPLQSAPSQIEQALEAARDDPSERQFINLLHSLDGISVLADGREEDWRLTQITVECHDEAMQSSTATRDLLTIARRAGWQLVSVGFNFEQTLVLIFETGRGPDGVETAASGEWVPGYDLEWRQADRTPAEDLPGQTPYEYWTGKSVEYPGRDSEVDHAE